MSGEGTPRETLDRGRRCVLGYLAPMILHETNNVLTVLAGIRQLLKLGRDLPDRVGPMIDDQITKMEHLLGWIRGMGPLDPMEGGHAPTTTSLASDLAALLQLAGKGRRLGAEAMSGESAPVAPGLVEPLVLSLLCACLPSFPPRSLEERTAITVRVAPAGEELVGEVRLTGLHTDPTSSPDLELARILATEAGGGLELEPVEGGLALAVRLPPPAA